MNQVEFLVYGKIIIDDIRLRSGQVERGILGGGGPQGAFGARLWADSVGFLSRSGSDIAEEHVQTLRDLDIDLAGWVRFDDIPTARGNMIYDDDEYILDKDRLRSQMITRRSDWLRLLHQRLPIPPHYCRPRAVHLITEFHNEPMVEDALRMRAAGALFSLEPILDYRTFQNRDDMLALMPQVDIVSPDWPAASSFAGSDDPKTVMQFWSRLGPKMVSVRHGHHGSYAWDQTHDVIWHIPAVPVEVVDPTGAGNSYAGGACVGWLETGDARMAAMYGAVSARYLVGRVGLPKMTPALRAEAHALLAQYIDLARPL